MCRGRRGAQVGFDQGGGSTAAEGVLLEHPDTTEPGVAHQVLVGGEHVAQCRFGHPVIAPLLDVLWKPIELLHGHQVDKEVVGAGRVKIALRPLQLLKVAEPDEHAVCRRVDVVHARDLPRPLGEVRLVDAHRVNPQEQLDLVGAASPRRGRDARLQCRGDAVDLGLRLAQVGRNLHGVAVDSDGPRRGWATPDVRQSDERRALGELEVL